MDPFTGAALATGAMSFLGGVLTNRGNAREAARNRAFQERMSSTAAQRAVEDYRKAGLNPALAYDRPASSPGGSQAQLTNPVPEGVSSALSVARYKWENEAVKQNALKAQAEAARTRVEGANALVQGQLLAQQQLLNANELSFRTAIQPHQTRAAALANMQSQFGLSKAEAEAKYYRMMGAGAFAIDNLAGPIGGLVGGAAGLGMLLRNRNAAGMATSSGKSLQGLFKPPAPRRTGDWERNAKPSGDRRPRGVMGNEPPSR